MASGSFNGTFSGTSASNVYPRIEWSSSSSIANNTSSVTAVLYFVKVSSYWKPFNLSGHSAAISINGNSATATRKFDLRSTSKYEIWRRTVNVRHNADGTKSITIKASSGSTGVSLGSYNFSGTANLGTIPRATQPSVTSSSAMGSNVTLNLPRASGSFTHTVKYGNAGHEKTWTGVGASLTYNFPSSEWAQKIQTSTSNGGIWTVTTYNGSTNLGTKTASMRLTIPGNVVPTTSSFTITESNAKAKAIMNDGSNFIQGISSLSLAISASGVDGSWINASETVIGGKTFSSTANSGRAVTVNLSDLRALTGTQAIKVRTRDSRGRWSGYVSKNINIFKYLVPTLALAANRQTNSTKVDFTKSATVSSLKIGTTEKNTYTTVTEYKLSSATTWSTAKTETNACANATIDGFAVDKSYDVRVTVTDKLNSSSSVATISTSKVLLDFYRDVGVGIGKMYEGGHGALDVGGDVISNGAIRVMNSKGIYGSPNMQDWLMSNQAKSSIISMNYTPDGTNEITSKGVGGVEYFSQPIQTRKGEPLSATFEYTQPDVQNSGTEGGVWVYFHTDPFANATTGLVKPGLGAMTSKSFTVTGTGNGGTMYLVFRFGGVQDGNQYSYKIKFTDENVGSVPTGGSSTLGSGALTLSSGTGANAVGGTINAYTASMMNQVGELLWSGDAFVTDTQVITPSTPISQCLNGWLLMWSKYADGATNEAEFIYSYIPKIHVAEKSGLGVSCVLPNFNGGLALNKYIYVSDASFKGNTKNNDGDLANYVLREVRAW